MAEPIIGQTNPIVRLIIDFNQTTQQVSVNGPLDNATLFLGMLEMAKVAMLEQRFKPASSIVRAVPMPNLNPNGK